MIYKFTIYPLQLIYKWLYLMTSSVIGSYGFSLIALSVITTILIMPFMRWANNMQASEKHLQDIMQPQLAKINKESSGAEKHSRTANLYKRYGYHPAMAIRSAAGVALQIPFLMAAYYMLSELPQIKGQAFWIIKDLSRPDGLLWGVNLLPILMTLINIAAACTTKNFRTKDKIQAGIIAFLFLILLYNAPAALLIFWTCNNLWVLLNNFVDIPGIDTVQIHPIARIADHIQCAALLSLSLTITLFIPLDIFLRNIAEFNVTIYEIVFVSLLICVIFFSISYGLYYLMKRASHLSRYFIITAISLTICLFLQAYICNLDYGVLDGRAIDWYKNKPYMILNTVMWGILFFAPFVLYKRFPTNKINRFFSCLLCGIVAAQILSTGLLVHRADLSKDNYYLSTDNMFEVSSKRNIIIFILDTFEAELLPQLMEKDPRLYTDLKDFIYYPDTVGSYPTTVGALPQILTGQWYELKEPYKEYIKKAWRKNSLAKQLHKEGYDIRILSDSAYVSPETPLVDNLKQGAQNPINLFNKKFMIAYAKITAFKAFPHLLKRHFLIYTDDLTKALGHPDTYKTDDVAFFQQMQKRGLTAINKPTFRFYHLQGPHGPFTMTENITRAKEGESSYEQQGLGSLRIVTKYLEHLREIGAYDNSEIIIMADHGNHSDKSPHHSPLLMVKPVKRKANFKQSIDSTSYEDLHNIIKKGNMVNDAQMSLGSIRTIRKFYLYDWDSAWDNRYMPMLIEYIVNGKAKDSNSWHLTGKKAKPNFGMINPIIAIPLNNPIYFNRDSVYQIFLDNGWSKPENWGTWTVLDKASIKFPAMLPKRFRLIIDFTAFGPNINKELVVKVGSLTYTKRITGSDSTFSFDVNLPKIRTNIIEILPPAPTSPKELGLSEDSRKLGIGIVSLTIQN